MLYKAIELVLSDRGTLYIVSPIDCVDVDIKRYDREPVVSHKVYDKSFLSIAEAWHFIGKLLDRQKASYCFIPKRRISRCQLGQYLQ